MEFQGKVAVVTGAALGMGRRTTAAGTDVATPFTHERIDDVAEPAAGVGVALYATRSNLW